MGLSNQVLYIIPVLIWGTTWYAIKMQVQYAPEEISILYREIIAACFLFLWCIKKKIPLNFALRDHLFFCFLGLSMFSVHYLFIYTATNYLLSGLIAVISSCVVFFNIFNNYIFYREKPKMDLILGSIVGVSGLCMIFWHELINIELQESTLKGLVLALIGTFIFSLGGSISRRNNENKIDLIPAMSFASLYGIVALLCFVSLRSTPLVLPIYTEYWLSLLYLALPGSVIAFLCYLKLVKNIGSGLAGYTMVFYSIVALLVSWFFEDYHFSVADLIGLSLVIFGNIIVLSKNINFKVNKTYLIVFL